MRVYLYITTQFVSYSSYIQDGLSIVSNQQTSLLNFLGQDVIDVTLKQNNYLQVQPTPFDGSYPLASNKWYMLQYELAYDPNISAISYNQIQMNFVLNYCNISRVNMEGDQVGKLYGTIGAIGNSNNLISKLTNTGEAVGTVVLAGIGKSFIDHNTIDSQGNNKLGIPKNTFNAISKGVSTAISNGASSLPGLGISILNALYGGSTSSTPVSLNMSTKINLNGSITSNGSFPSMPISHWMPGTSIPISAVGYIPNYDNVLGVVNLRDKPTVNLEWKEVIHYVPDEPFDPERITNYTEITITPMHSIDYSYYLIVNPEVARIANVAIMEEKLIFLTGYYETEVGSQPLVEVSPRNPLYFVRDNRGGANTYPLGHAQMSAITAAVRMTIRVAPKDGSPISTIIKTFKLNTNFTQKTEYVNGW